jgi:hypothetical protein
MVYQVRRWLAQRVWLVLAASGYAALEFLHAVQTLLQPVTLSPRWRRAAALYETAPPYSGQGRPRQKGQRWPTPEQTLATPHTAWLRLSLACYGQPKRTIEAASAMPLRYHAARPGVPSRCGLISAVLGQFKPPALLSTDLHRTALQSLTVFMRRWPRHPTVQHGPAHLAVETQRQWSANALARTPPGRLGLCSWISLLAASLSTRHALTLRTAAWHPNRLPTFSDTLAVLRRPLWPHLTFQLSAAHAASLKVPPLLLEPFHDLFSYAASCSMPR